MRWTAPAPHPPAGTFSPQAGRRGLAARLRTYSGQGEGRPACPFSPFRCYGMHISLVVQPLADLLRSGGICISSSGEACGWVLGIKLVCADIGIIGHPPLIRLPAPSPRRRGEGTSGANRTPHSPSARGSERARHIPSPRLRGEGGGSRLRGNPDRAGLRRLGSRGIPFMSSIRRTGPQEICACRSHEMRRRCRQADEGRRRTHCSSDRLPRNKKAPVKTEASCQSRLLTSKRINVPCSRRPTSSSGR